MRVYPNKQLFIKKHISLRGEYERRLQYLLFLFSVVDDKLCDTNETPVRFTLD